jgi:hypothetical protein
MSILGRVIKTFGSLREPVKKIAQVGYNVGKWAVNNHSTIVPLLHGVSMLSGNQKAQQITGGLLALSKTASLRQGMNAGNDKIKAEMGRGGYGVFDAGAGKMSRYGT